MGRHNFEGDNNSGVDFGKNLNNETMSFMKSANGMKQKSDLTVRTGINSFFNDQMNERSQEENNKSTPLPPGLKRLLVFFFSLKKKN